MKTWSLLALLFTLSACSANSGARHNAETPFATPGGWVEITPQPVLIDGRFITATCSHAPGADPAYRFWARRGVGDGLVVFFDGGGACWDDITCSVPRMAGSTDPRDGFYKAELLASDNPNGLGGVFDLDNPRNPVRDWSFVFVPYCTGDVHSGSNSARYTDVDSGEPFMIEHRGADNFRVVLQWMRAHVDAPQTILVAGSSAGAYGAATHYARIREAFPDGRAIMLGDAGQGVTTPDFLGKRNGNWRYDLPRSVFGAHAALTLDDDIVRRLATHYPHDLFAQYTTAHDRTQVGFFAMMGAEHACRAWTETMTRDLARRQSAGNFRSYLANGQTHTILRSPLFYGERSGGAPFAEWVGALVAGEAPDNRACVDCLAPPARCPFS